MFNCTILDENGNQITNLTQWDSNVTLYIEEHGFEQAPQFHFCNKNSEKALVVDSVISNGILSVKVPNILLTESLTITAYIYVSTDETGKTVDYFQISVRQKPQPNGFVYEDDTEIISVKDLAEEIKALNDSISVAEEERVKAENTRISNEETRIENEEARQSAETDRTEAEAERADAEENRVSAESTRVSNENARKTAEINRDNAESTRETNETARVNAENERVSAENTRSSNETARATAEEERDEAEDIRVDNESTRILNEQSRETAESSRVSAETSRVNSENTRESNETIRESNENTRNTTEQSRITAEDTRESNENTRKSNETERQTAETNRASAETGRVNAEKDRVSAETVRANAETDRVESENERVDAESSRVTAENGRASAEATRQSQEEERQTNTATAISNAEVATDRANIAAEACEGIIEGTGLVPSTEKGAANGIATLDENALIPIEQLPDIDAAKLGGKDASEYALDSDLTEHALPTRLVTSETAFYDLLNTYSANMGNNVEYQLAVSVGFSDGALNNGTWKIYGFKNDSGYETQLAVKHQADTLLLYGRSKTGGTWYAFDKISTGSDLANYFKKTGGTINGSVYQQLDTAAALIHMLENPARKIFQNISAEGVYDLYDGTNNDYIIHSTKAGTNTFNGTSTDSAKLGGKDASEYMLVKGVELNTSILEYALTLPNGEHFVRLSGNYAGGDLPAFNYCYGNAKIYKRSSQSVTVELIGSFTLDERRKAVNFYNSGTWSGWIIEATTSDLANYFMNTGGVVDGNVFAGTTEAKSRTVGIYNSARDIFIQITSDGTYKIHDNTNNKDIIYSTKDGATTVNADVNGTASGNLPTDGSGYMKGALTFNYNGRNVYFQITSNGRFVLVDSTNGKVVMELSADGTNNTFNGTASGNLPLSGGRIDGAGYYPLEINGTSSNNENYLKLLSNGTLLGSLGFYGVNTPVLVKTDGSAVQLLHLGNMADHVLPLSGGGTINTTTPNDVKIKRAGTGYAGVVFENDNGAVGIGTSENSLSVMSADGGTIGNILHTGNTVTIAQGGTGATTAANARTNLGLGAAATASTTTSVTSGSSALITSGAVYTALSGKAASSHNQAASTITAGTLGGSVVANATAVSTLGTKQVRNIYAGTSELTSGTSALPAGDIYVQFE